MHSVSLSCSVFSNGLGNVAFHKERKNIHFIEIDRDFVLYRYIIWDFLFVFYTNISSKLHPKPDSDCPTQVNWAVFLSC